MPSTGLRGPYPLNNTSIDINVTAISPGAYALGAMSGNTFVVSYVGRADKDVRGRLKDWVGSYDIFKFDYFGSAKAAFEKECHLYHDFTPPGNKIHPDRPDGSSWSCPRCYLYD